MDRSEMRSLWNDSGRIRAGASAGTRPGLDFSREEAERAMESYETEYEIVAEVDPRTGRTRFYLPSTYRAMAAARIRRDRKRALRREMARLGISDITIV